MPATERWLLPAGVEEILPPRAWQLDALRRRLLDLYWSWGYDLMFPPFIEYLESLLTGTANDLELQTFKVMDQMSGRLMGIRADMTPQAARIDAHVLQRESPVRLCYLGSVLRARPEGVSTSRSPLQVGAEIFGHEGAASDTEVVALMLETLKAAGLQGVTLDLGHVGVYRQIVAQAELAQETERELFEILRRKAVPEFHEALAQSDLEPSVRERLSALIELHGGAEVLEQTRTRLADKIPGVGAALERIETVADFVARRYPEVQLHFDLGELHSYHYENGLVFAAFRDGEGQALARGGRYDGIGEAFGRARPATGFSADLKRLMPHDGDRRGRSGTGIFAPATEDPALEEAILRLRRQGERVVRALPGDGTTAVDYSCDRQLVQDSDGWTVRPSD